MNTTTYNFTLVNEGEIITNVAKNTFNNYNINDIRSIELICNIYKVNINIKHNLHTFNVTKPNNSIIYWQEISDLNNEIMRKIIAKYNVKYMLNVYKAKMMQLIKCYEFNINRLKTEIDDYKQSSNNEYRVYLRSGEVTSSNNAAVFKDYIPCYVNKIIIVKHNYVGIFTNNTLKFKHNNAEHVIEFPSTGLNFSFKHNGVKREIKYIDYIMLGRSVPSLINTLEEQINAIIAA